MAGGELGILPADVPAFLTACHSDGVEVLGWELWVVDHSSVIEERLPVPAKGAWCGGIPVNTGNILAIISGTGDAGETERQLADIDLQTEVQAAWLPYIRINFTLDL